MANLFSVKDKVVVITGGTGVLGKAIAAHLAEEGAKVILLGRKTEVGNKIVESIRTQGGEALFLTTDVLDRKILEQNLADILKAYGRIDALLNAAGGNMPGATISPTGDIFDLKIDEFQKVLDLNLTGTILPTQVFLKPMVEQRAGAIVNFSSMAAFRPLTRVAGYAAAKAGITNFTAFMATEIAKKFGEGIRINAIAPGFFPDRTESCTTNQSGRYLYTTGTRRNPSNAIRAYGTCRRVMRNNSIPHQRRSKLCNGYSGGSGWRIQCLCDVKKV